MTDAKMCPTIAVDADGLRALRERSRAIGTLDAWADVALEWADHAQKEISRFRAAPPVEAEEVARLRAQIEQLTDALYFYADADTYFAVAFGFDPPCGDFADDFEFNAEYGREMPGERARAALSGGGNG